MDEFRHHPIHIPAKMPWEDELSVAQAAGQTDQTFTLVIERNGKPVVDRPYLLDLDGVFSEGRTDGDGCINMTIAGGVVQARLFLRNQLDPYCIRFGPVDPVETPSGLQVRLTNLGFYDGPIDNRLHETTSCALTDFQIFYELPVTGRCDQDTCRSLLEKHGC